LIRFFGVCTDLPSGFLIVQQKKWFLARRLRREVPAQTRFRVIEESASSRPAHKVAKIGEDVVLRFPATLVFAPMASGKNPPTFW